MEVGDGDWDAPYPFDAIQIDPDDMAEWEALRDDLCRESEDRSVIGTDRPLARCLEVAKANNARSIIVETRYIDLDYRSEFSALYSKAFERYEDACRRLHFFSETVAADDVWRLNGKQRESYLGYMILRPRVLASVGRTMLAPPEGLETAVRTGVVEQVTFFGQSLEVRAVPFMQQDARLGSCAHVAIWMCHYSAYRADHRVARQPVADFSLLTDPSLGLGRTLPSAGMTLLQMSDLLGRNGLPCIYYEVDSLTDDDRPADSGWLRTPGDKEARVSRVACRYLNSGLPIIAVVRHAKGAIDEDVDLENAPMHAVVVCGYYRSGPEVCLVAHDDRRGPYLTFGSVVDDFDDLWSEHCRWKHLLAPVPMTLWLTGEAAERAGCEFLVAASRQAAEEGGIVEAGVVAAKFDGDDLRCRTYAITGNRLKKRLCEAIDDPVIRRAYREARFPHYVWVVEAVDKTKRAEKEPKSVLAEVMYDATSDERAPRILASRLPGVVAIARPDQPTWARRVPFDGYRPSAGQYSP